MGLTQKQLNQLLTQWMASAEARSKGQESANQLALEGNIKEDVAQGDRDAELRRLIRGKELDLDNNNTIHNRDLETAKRLRQEYGPKASVDAGTVRIGAEDRLKSFLMPLTPAQETSEKDSGKQVSNYETGGGRATMEKNLMALEKTDAELTSGKRDMWDRVVGGGAAKISPTVMGWVAPAEKERRDRIHRAGGALVKQTDPNATQQQVEAIMGQIYDPSSDDATNLARVQDFLLEQKKKAAAIEAAAERLRTTGYAMPGLGGGGGRAAPSQDSGYEDEEGGVDEATAEANLRDAYRTQPGAQGAPETKVIKGVTYQKVPGGWKRVN
jgi:hypothetical protein